MEFAREKSIYFRRGGDGLGFQDQRDGTIVTQKHLHIGLKHTGFNLCVAGFGVFDTVLVESYRVNGWGGVTETGAHAFGGIGG